jgi:hypothetical protein
VEPFLLASLTKILLYVCAFFLQFIFLTPFILFCLFFSFPLQQKKALPFAQQMGTKMDYIVACDTTHQTNASYMQKYGIRGIPHAFIIGKDGEVLWHGHPMEPDFENRLNDALKVPSKVHFDAKHMTAEQLMELGVKDLKQILQSHNIDYSGAVEKSELVKLIKSKI